MHLFNLIAGVAMAATSLQWMITVILRGPRRSRFAALAAAAVAVIVGVVQIIAGNPVAVFLGLDAGLWLIAYGAGRLAKR